MVPRQRLSMVNLQTIHNTTLTETANLDYPLGNVRTALQVQETRLIAAIQSTKYLKRTTGSVCHLKEVCLVQDNIPRHTAQLIQRKQIIRPMP